MKRESRSSWDVADRGLVKKVPVALFLLADCLFVTQALQLRRCPRRANSQGEQRTRFRGQRLLVEDRQVAQPFPFCVNQRHTQVTLDPPID